MPNLELLDSCDSGGDGFGVLHHAAALGRLDLIQVILERGVGVDTPSGTQEEYSDTEAERPKFEPGFTPLMCAAAHGQLATVRHLISVGADPSRRITTVAPHCIPQPRVDQRRS